MRGKEAGMDKNGYVYILTNIHNTVFYIGVTSNLKKRIFEHKNKLADGFTKKYNICKLVYYECSNNILSAIEREKQIKNWHRNWKINLIKTLNAEFKDLYDTILD
jgi:putative endonuclease